MVKRYLQVISLDDARALLSREFASKASTEKIPLEEGCRADYRRTGLCPLLGTGDPSLGNGRNCRGQCRHPGCLRPAPVTLARAAR